MKYLITLLSLFISYNFAVAQDDYENPEWKKFGNIEFGLLAGFTNSSLTERAEFEDIDFELSGNSWLVGATTDFYFNKNWSIRARANYENRNFNNLDANFISFALEPNWHFGKNRRWNLHLGANYSHYLENNQFLQSSFGTDFGIELTIPISDINFFVELNGVSDFKSFEFLLTDINGNLIGTESFSSNRSSISIGVHF